MGLRVNPRVHAGALFNRKSTAMENGDRMDLAALVVSITFSLAIMAPVWLLLGIRTWGAYQRRSTPSSGSLGTSRPSSRRSSRGPRATAPSIAPRDAPPMSARCSRATAPPSTAMPCMGTGTSAARRSSGSSPSRTSRRSTPWSSPSGCGGSGGRMTECSWRPPRVSCSTWNPCDTTWPPSGRRSCGRLARATPASTAPTSQSGRASSTGGRGPTPPCARVGLHPRPGPCPSPVRGRVRSTRQKAS